MSRSAQLIFEEKGDLVAWKCLEMAQKGDRFATKLCMERILPRMTEAPIHFEIPAIKSLADLPAAYHSVLDSVANGEITLKDAGQIYPMIDRVETAMRQRQSLDAAETPGHNSPVGSLTAA
jgi:hypothetical protein